MLRAWCIGAVSLWAACARAQTAPATATEPATAAPPAAGASAAAAAPAAPAPDSLSIVFTPNLVNQFMFRGQLVCGPSFEPSLDFDTGDWAVGVWSNIPLADRVTGQPEIDLYGSYTYSISDSLSLQPGFTLYDYLNAPTDQGYYRLTFEPSLSLTYAVGGIGLTPKVYYDVVLGGPTYEFDVSYTTPLKQINSELDWTGTVGTYDLSNCVKGANPDVRSYGNYWLVGVSMPFTVNKAGTLTIGFAYTEGTDAYNKQNGSPKSVNTAAVGRGVVTLGYIWTF
jgi:uncharacterized protein (TIGR02001 family)